MLRNPSLMFREHVDTKPLARVEVSVSTGLMTYTDQHQHRIERNRCERICGHAFHSAVIIDRDDRHPGGKASHGAAEFVLGGAHGLNQSCTTNADFRCGGGFRYDSF